jgi:hypothetical protein
VHPVAGHVCSWSAEALALDVVAWQLTAVQPVEGHVSASVVAVDATAVEETLMFDTMTKTPMPVSSVARRTMIVFSSKRGISHHPSFGLIQPGGYRF